MTDAPLDSMGRALANVLHTAGPQVRDTVIAALERAAAEAPDKRTKLALETLASFIGWMPHQKKRASYQVGPGTRRYSTKDRLTSTEKTE
jgi:hypothetical protein